MQRSPSPQRGASYREDPFVVAGRAEHASRQLGLSPVISAAAQSCAGQLGVKLVPSTSETAQGEAALWRECISWAVTKTKCRLVAVIPDGRVIAACYYTLAEPKASLSALAVMPSARGRRLGKMLIASSVAHMHAAGCTAVELRVQTCDQTPERHELCARRTQRGAGRGGERRGDAVARTFALACASRYSSCGFRGGHAKRGGTYMLTGIPERFDVSIVRAPRSRDKQPPRSYEHASTEELLSG